MSITAPATRTPLVADSITVDARPDATYLEMRDHRGHVIAYLPAAAFELTALVTAVTVSQAGITRRIDSALTDAVTDFTDEVSDWLARHPLDA